MTINKLAVELLIQPGMAVDVEATHQRPALVARMVHVQPFQFVQQPAQRVHGLEPDGRVLASDLPGQLGRAAFGSHSVRLT